MATLDAQVKQLGVQATHDCDGMAKEREATLQLLHKVPKEALKPQVRILWQIMHAIIFFFVGAGQVVRPGEQIPQHDRW